MTDDNPSSAVTHSFQGLIYRVFQNGHLPEATRGVATAFIAAHPRAGTTFLTNRISHSLVQGSAAPIAVLDCRRVTDDGFEGSLLAPNGNARQATMCRIHSPSLSLAGDWRSDKQYRKECLERLRASCSYVLLDCPSLQESDDVLGIASMVEGVVLVVEANRTTRDQLGRLERTITSAGGKILGTMLNKRRYPIPRWLY